MPDQPRKHFAADLMHTLTKSIKTHGIQNPLVVMKDGKGMFMLLDGERRFRAAKDLGLKEVPVTVKESMEETDQLVLQFNIQEHHAEWSPLEKAVALTKLTKKLGGSIHQVCDMLGMGKHEKEIYGAFADLADREAYVKNEIPLEMVKPFRSIRNTVKKLYVEELGEPMIRSDEKKLELALIRSVKDGAIQERKDFTRLKDAFVKNPKLIGEYMADKHATPDAMFIKAKAKGTYYLRNLTSIATHGTNMARRLVENASGLHADDTSIKRIRELRDELTNVLKVIE